MNKLFTKDDQLWKLPAKGFLNHNISIIKFEIFHLLVFCPEILLGLIRKTDLNHPGAASWNLLGIFKISTPATTQYDVNVRAQLCGLRASRTGLAPLTKGSSHAARLSWDILSSGKKTFPLCTAVRNKVLKMQRRISQLSRRREEQGLETPVPPKTCKGAQPALRQDLAAHGLPGLHNCSCHWLGHSHPSWKAKHSTIFYSWSCKKSSL